ncbi:unnamed protein product [Brassica rapa subsp. trilocularis]
MIDRVHWINKKSLSSSSWTIRIWRMEASQTDLTMMLISTTPTLELHGFHFLSTVESKQLIQPTLCLLMSSTGSSSTNEGR